MWISYAGRDSSELVESVVSELNARCSKLQVNRYKKRINVFEQLSSEGQSLSDKRAQDDWPAHELIGTGEREQFHLLPMDALFELVVEIAFSPRALVVLSPAYFQSEPCLQELAAIISLEMRSLPLFVLNGITHEEIGKGVITVNTEGKSVENPAIDIAAELVRVREEAHEMNKVGCFSDLTVKGVKSYLQRIVKHNMPETEQGISSAEGTVEPSSKRPVCIVIDPKSSKSASTIGEGVKAHFVDRPGIATYYQILQHSDCERFRRWFETKFGKVLLDQINRHRANPIPAIELVQQLMNDPNDVHQLIVDALHVMNEERAEAPADGLGNFKDDDNWNFGISELAGLYALTLIDHESLVSLKGNSTPDLSFVTFSVSNFQASFQACIVNSSLQESMIRIRPVDESSKSGAPKTPSFEVYEKEMSAGDDEQAYVREFVEALHVYVARRSSMSCPKSDPNHATKMSNADRLILRGQVKGFRKTHGPGSLIITINRAGVTSGRNWWDAWDEVHAALNDGAAPHSVVRLRGIVINQRDDTTTIQMHKDYEERLGYIYELLEDHYLI